MTKRTGCLLAVDIGSSSIKSTLFDPEGRALGEARRDNHPHQPKAGVAEYDGDAMAAATVACIRDVLAASGINGKGVAALCMDGMISGTIGADRAGDATTAYTTPLDMRFAPQMNFAMDHHHDHIRRLTGSGMAVIGPKIMWIRDDFPEAYARTEKFLTATGYVAMKLAGQTPADAFMDFTYLWTTGLSDTLHYRWSPELCEALGVSASKLPAIVKPTDIVGAISRAAAAQTGLLEGTPLVAGAGDQTAGFVGAGLTKTGRMADVAGTYPVLALCTAKFAPDMAHRSIEIFPSPVPGLFNPCSIINGGGLTHHWFKETFAGDDARAPQDLKDGRTEYSLLDERAALLPPGSDRLLFNPHLCGRMCPVETSMRGAWMGFTWTHKREHFYRALLEGIAYDHRLAWNKMQTLYPGFHTEEVVVFGGGSRSSLWNQIKADVMGLPYVASRREDMAGLGSAIIAGCAIGMYDDLAATAERMLDRGDRYEPDPARHGLYAKQVELYEKLLAASTPVYEGLAALAQP
jgi:xylulokinase